jgi:hypothetical protein
MSTFANGTPAGQLGDVQWRKATATVPFGACVELSALPDGQIGMRNSRDPDGPALVYTRRELAAFVHGAQAGEFDDLTV